MQLGLSQFANGRHHLGGVPPQPVDANDHDGIPLARIVQQRGQARTVFPRRSPRQLVAVDARGIDARSSVRIDLLVDMQYFDPAVTGETSVHKEGLVVFFTRLAMASVCVAGLGVGLAGPANAADPHALGTYTLEGEDGESATWTVTPCDDDTDHCVRVAEAGNSKRAPWSANAYWSVGSWILFVDQPDAILCKNGTSVPGRNNYSWDATSLSGFASTFSNGACNSAPQSVAIPFKLIRVAGSGPVQYPTEPVDAQPYVPPLSAESAFTPAEPMPVESDPNLVAEPPVVPSGSDQLTEAEVAEPGFNGGGDR